MTVDNSVPVVPPLLGSMDIGGNPDSNRAGFAEAFQMTADNSGALSTLHLYVDGGSSASDVMVGVYSDDGSDQPGMLLTQATLSAPTAGSWNTISVGPLPIVAQTKYWIALLSPTGAGAVAFRDATSGGLAVGDANAGDILPETWTTTDGPWHNAPLSAYGTS